MCQIFFAVPSLAFILIGIGFFFAGTVFTIVILLIEQLMEKDETLVTAYLICGNVFMILPQYNLGMALYRLNFIYTLYDKGLIYLQQISREDEISHIPLPHPLEWHLMGRHCFALFVEAIVFITILMIVEYRHLLCKFIRNWEKRRTEKLVQRKIRTEWDDDVLREQEKVKDILRNDKTEEFGLVVDSLAKSYKPFKGKTLAVNNVSFAINKGECFGLLGVNGAGKTTTFSMLTGYLDIGAGDALIHGCSVSQGGFSSLRQLGYCPQFDALFPKLTGREQLAFYCRLRRIPENKVDEVVEWALGEMQLRTYADEISASYSGGNKRKLSAAIALIADPPVVLLDEPSAGMDPSSQHFMWNLILQLRRAKHTVLITSHSMEECEMLCTRIAIMVNGQFECIGPVQHLKQKFGGGYTLTIKLCSGESVKKATDFMEKNLHGGQLEAVHCSNLFYRIPSEVCTVAEAFGVICRLREEVKLDDYSLSQTTLDEVFVSFARRSCEELNNRTPGNVTPSRSPPLHLHQI